MFTGGSSLSSILLLGGNTGDCHVRECTALALKKLNLFNIFQKQKNVKYIFIYINAMNNDFSKININPT